MRLVAAVVVLAAAWSCTPRAHGHHSRGDIVCLAVGCPEPR